MNPIIDSVAAYALNVFLLSCLLGAILSAFYGIFKILRIAVKFNAITIAVQDFVFWFLSGLAVFMFALWQSDGIVRGYVLIGVLIGALIYYLTIGELLTRSAAAIVGFFQRISGKIKSAAKKRKERVRQKQTERRLRHKTEKEQARQIQSERRKRRKTEKEQVRLKKEAKRAKKTKIPQKRRKKREKNT